MRTLADATIEQANGIHAQTGALRQFLLREAHLAAEAPQQFPERQYWAVAHDRPLPGGADRRAVDGRLAADHDSTCACSVLK